MQSGLVRWKMRVLNIGCFQRLQRLRRSVALQALIKTSMAVFDLLPRRRWRPVPIKASIAVIDLAGVRSLGAAEIRLGLCWIATLRVPNIGAGAHFLLRDKDPRQSNSGFQPVMKLIQEILDFFAIIVLKELHA